MMLQGNDSRVAKTVYIGHQQNKQNTKAMHQKDAR